jgi:hypothetical protein
MERPERPACLSRPRSERRSERRRIARALAPALAAALLALALAPAGALAQATWKLVAFASPTNLQANTPRDEVRTLAVAAGGGSFTLTMQAGHCGIPETTGPLAFDAAAGEVQTALESLCEGTGNVTVTGGPGGAAPYVVTFTGGLANQPIATLSADGSQLTGAPARATVTRTVEGAFAPQLTVIATNVGGEPSDGSTIALHATLPAGVEASAITGFDAYASGFAFNRFGAGALSCTEAPAPECTSTRKVDPGDSLIMTITLKAPGSVAPAQSLATVSGGGAAEASFGLPLATGGAPAPFGPAAGTLVAAPATTQAGAHANFTSAFAMNTDEVDGVAGDAKDIRFDLPPGFVGSTVGMAHCAMTSVLEQLTNSGACPADTMVGMATVIVNTEGPGNGDETFVTPVYNIAPLTGEPAAFAFDAAVLPVRLDTSVLSDGSDGVRVTAANLSEAAKVIWTSITLWGVPADQQGPGENGDETFFGGRHFGGPNPGVTRAALLTNPQQCSQPATTLMSADAWAEPGRFVSQETSAGTPSGCEALSLEPSFTLLPDTLQAGAPAGYTFDLRVPQHSDPNALATPALRGIELSFPAGVVISPAAASGLGSCTDSQFFGAQRGQQEPASAAECPASSQIGSVEVQTPSFAQPLHGQLYLGAPECAVCGPSDAQDGALVRLFMQVSSVGETPVVVKLEGRGHIDQQSGQVTTSFENSPQLPLAEVRVALKGGSRAPLANQRACGQATSALQLTPWSAPFTPVAASSYAFAVNQGCFGPRFAPSFTAGALDIQAGGFSPFALAFGREDADQFLGAVTAHLPAGLLGELAALTPCSQAQAAAGTCGPESLIGHTEAQIGPGPTPYTVKGGQIFLTEAYGEGQFGLAIVEPAAAGPYTLAGTTGHGTIVVRAAVAIDPYTAALTIASDPLPTSLDGIPLQIKAIATTVDRPGFMFDPTSCARTAIAATISSSEGAHAQVASPFQVANCAALPFKPSFTVATAAKTSRTNGASLHVEIAQRRGEANIRRVDLQLPRALPSRLSTLRKACTEAQFDANPAGCPAESVIGSGRAATPVLRAPLTGPAYLVSHGGAAFPDVEFVLQASERGGNVEIVLDGKTQIKRGITSSHFETVPDAPVSSFEASFPQGPHSVLTAANPGHTNLCALSLAIPTTLTGQNGAEVKQSTKLAVSGCRPVTIVKRELSRRDVIVSFKLTRGGTVTAGGAGLERYRARLGAGLHQIALPLSRAGLALRTHRRKIVIRVALGGRRGASASTTLRL